jgi:predicted dehydrogenase
MSTPLRWGILGTGRIAGQFTDDLRRSGAGHPVAAGSRTLASAERFVAEHGAGRPHGSYEALVADPDVDAVYIATPHPVHHDNALLAIAAGKPVLVEKAFTMDASEAMSVVSAARRAGVFAMEAMWTRCLPHITAIKELVASGALGDLVSVSADHGQWFAPDPGSRLFAPELGGGALLDLGVYVVSFASMVLGPPDRVVSLVEPAFTGVDGQTSILLHHPGGAHAVLTCTSSARTPTTASIVGTDGRIEIDRRFYAPTSWTFHPRDGEPIHHPADHRHHGLWYEAAEVARCLNDGLLESPLMPLDETVAIMATMDAVVGAAGA